MIDHIYIIIAITIILLIINIHLSLYIYYDDDDDVFYEDNYLYQYYKFKNLNTIIPFDFEETIYENDDFLNKEFYLKNMNELGKFPIIFKNYKYDESDKPLSNCQYLLAKFIFCLYPENENKYKCQKLFREKMKELEKCYNVKYNYSIKNNNDVVLYNLNNFEMKTYIDEEFEKEKKLNKITENSIKNENITKNDEEKPKKNQLTVVDKNNEENLNYNNFDCVEYGLIDEHIICTKYE